MKRLRIIAGPNGSGKTSLYEDLLRMGSPHFGLYVNADEIEAKLKKQGFLSIADYGIVANEAQFQKGYNMFLSHKVSAIGIDGYSISDNYLLIQEKEKVDAYFACYVAAYLRDEMLAAGIDRITIETVMSHSSKLDLMRKAKERGYRIYLYFVASEDPRINVGRVESRRDKGGHWVSVEKILDRYSRSLDNLYDAMILSDRAFLFDNSGKNHEIIAEYDSAKEELKVIGFQKKPFWLQKYVIDKIH